MIKINAITIIGCLGALFCGWLLLSLCASNPSINANELGYVSGVLQRTEEQYSGKSLQLHLWLQGHSMPFVASGIQYPQAYNMSVMTELLPSANVRIGYEKRDISNKFIYIVTLDINEHQALSLESSNSAASKNVFFGKILAVFFLLTSFALIRKGSIRQY
jgi:hypothetical protein